MSQSVPDAPFDGQTGLLDIDAPRVESGIDAADLEPAPGRLGQQKMCCPHPDCPWWVPEGREHLADSHSCVGPYYEQLDRDGLIDTCDVDGPEDYVEKFIGDDGTIEFEELAADAIPRPRSERLRLLFDFDAFDYQQAAIDDQNPDKSVNLARQVGKTETGGAIGADSVLFSAYPDGHDVAFFGDVADTAYEMFRRCKQRLKQCPLPLELLNVNKDNETYWEFGNGETRLVTGSLNNGGDNERGKLPKVVIVDEAALCERSSFVDVIEPMFATHGDDHELFVMSTPRGQTGFHFDANQPDRDPRYFSVHNVPTWANPLVSEGWLARRQASVDSDTWQQEYLGIFIEEGNNYIPTSLYRRCQTDFRTTDVPATTNPTLRVVGHPLPDTTYFIGVDVAGAGTDRTVYLVITADGTVVHVESEDTSQTPNVLGRVGELYREFDSQSIYVDKNSLGEGVVSWGAVDDDPGFRRALDGIPFSTPRKSAMYKSLKQTFESSALQLPKHGALERETTRLTFEFTANRHVRVHHPENGHDDHPDALALANYARLDASRGPNPDRPDDHGIRSV